MLLPDHPTAQQEIRARVMTLTNQRNHARTQVRDATRALRNAEQDLDAYNERLAAWEAIEVDLYGDRDPDHATGL